MKLALVMTDRIGCKKSDRGGWGHSAMKAARVFVVSWYTLFLCATGSEYNPGVQKTFFQAVILLEGCNHFQ